MKLKEFNPENCVVTKANRATAPSVNINLKSGLLRFSTEASKLIGLKDGDHVVLHQDEDDPTNWYVEKVPVKQAGFVLRQVKNTQSFLFNNAPLARQIAASVDFNGKSGKVLIAGEPTKFKNRELFGVITGTLINK